MPDRPPLVLVPQYFGSLVFDRRSSRYLPFDAEATALLEALVERPLRDLAGHPALGSPGLGDFLEPLHRRGFFRPDGRLAAARLPIAEVPPDHLVGPLAVHLEVAAACNLACTHCFAGALPRREEGLELPELARLFAELAGLGCFRLGLTGGEPLLRRDLLAILDAALDAGLHPCLTTNALLLTEALARELGRRPLVWLNVSLEGARPETNDPVRGPGTFERVTRQVRMLARHARFTLAFTLMRSNLGEVEDCARLAAELGASTAVFRPLYPVGTAAGHLELMPSYAEYADALTRLARLGGTRGFELGSPDPFSPAARTETQARTYTHAGCGAANLVASISFAGRVNPCSFLGPDHDAGDLRVTPFATLWHTSPAFRALRAPAGDGCGACGSFEGGCRARSQAYAGSVHGPDPWYRDWRARTRGVHPKSNLELEAEPP